MALDVGLARAHRLHAFVSGVNSDTRLLVWPNGRMPGYEAKGFRNWAFTAISSGTVTGTPTVSVYGTLDPITAYSQVAGFPTLTGARWFLLPAQSEQTGTGIVSNPITAFDGSQSMEYRQSLEAYGILVTGTWTGGGTINVDVFMA